MGTTDGRTDRHGDSSIPPPPNFVAGGIIIPEKALHKVQQDFVKIYCERDIFNAFHTI